MCVYSTVLTSSLCWGLPASERRSGSYSLLESVDKPSICPTSWSGGSKEENDAEKHMSTLNLNISDLVQGVCFSVLRACKCPAAACPAWLKSSEKTMANREEASLCWELTQPKDLRMVNMACTRSTTDRGHGLSAGSRDVDERMQLLYSPLIFSPVVPACLRRACVKAWHAVVLPVPLRPTAHTLWSLLVPTNDT